MTTVLENPSAGALVEVFDKPHLAIIEQDYFGRVYDELKREADDTPIDLETEKGRKAIASMAYKVARTKTAIDDAGKALNEDANRQIKAVDAKRREIREKLDALKDAVRAPLTAWEEAEKAREAKFEAACSALSSAAKVAFDDTADDVAARIDALETYRLGADHSAGQRGAVDMAITRAKDALVAAVERLRREEADRVELERLRAEAAARAEREAAAEEAARQTAREEAARAAEAERVARQEAEQKAAIERAAETARAEAERKANEEHARQLAKLAEEKAAVEREAAAKEAERNRIAAAAEQTRQREAAELAARERNKAHRSKIMTEAKQAIIACDVSEATARSIVLAILANQIPHTTISF